MPKRARPTTAEGKIADVIIAAELREALALLPPPEPSAIRVKRRPR